MPKKSASQFKLTAVLRRREESSQVDFKLEMIVQAQTAEQAFLLIAEKLALPGVYVITCRRGRTTLLRRFHTVRSA